LQNMKVLDFFQERGILSPTLDEVKHVNEFLLSLVPEDEKEYISSDSVCKSDENNEVQSVYLLRRQFFYYLIEQLQYSHTQFNFIYNVNILLIFLIFANVSRTLSLTILSTICSASFFINLLYLRFSVFFFLCSLERLCLCACTRQFCSPFFKPFLWCLCCCLLHD
jgi:hypothetical protein